MKQLDLWGDRSAIVQVVMVNNRLRVIPITLPYRQLNCTFPRKLRILGQKYLVSELKEAKNKKHYIAIPPFTKISLAKGSAKCT